MTETLHVREISLEKRTRFSGSAAARSPGNEFHFALKKFLRTNSKNYSGAFPAVSKLQQVHHIISIYSFVHDKKIAECPS